MNRSRLSRSSLDSHRGLAPLPRAMFIPLIVLAVVGLAVVPLRVRATDVPPQTPVMGFIDDGRASFRTPDGTTWFLANTQKRPDGGMAWVYTPGAAVQDNWTEQLIFSYGTESMSRSDLERMSQRVRELDPGYTSSFETLGENAFLFMYDAPSWNEVGTMRLEIISDVIRSIGYQSRLGPEGAGQLARWQGILRTTSLADSHSAEP